MNEMVKKAHQEGTSEGGESVNQCQEIFFYNSMVSPIQCARQRGHAGKHAACPNQFTNAVIEWGDGHEQMIQSVTAGEMEAAG